ncbi:hypothetical protein [Hydrogenimonas sp.]
MSWDKRLLALLLLPVLTASAAINYNQIKKINGKTIPVAKGIQMKIPPNVQKLFVQTKALSTKLKKINIKPKIAEKVQETPKQLIFIKKTQFTLKNPSQFNKVFMTRPPKKMPRINKRAQKEYGSPVVDEKRLKEFIKNFKRHCKPVNPFCRKTAKELEKALRDHTGTYEIEEKVVVNKQPLYVDIKKLRLNLPNRSIVTVKPPKGVKKEFIPFHKAKKAPLEHLAKKALNSPAIKPYAAPKSVSYGTYQKIKDYNPNLGGIARKGKKFLNGFTLGGEYSYTYSVKYKKWGKTIASVKVWSYLGAGFGLRTPYEMFMVMAPERVDRQQPVNTVIYFEAKDFRPRDYRAVGIPDYQVFDGKEFVLRLGAQIGGTAKLFGETIFDSYLGKIVDNSRDFATPMGGERVVLKNIELHGKDIGLYYGNTESVYVEGNIRFDFFLEGKKMKMKVEGNGCRPDRTTLAFTKKEQKFTFKLKNLGTGIHEERQDSYGKYKPFGVKVKDLRYESAAGIATYMNLVTWINTDWIAGWVDVATPWLHIYTFTLDLPDLTTHSGTASKLTIDSGRYYVEVKQKQSGSNVAVPGSHTGSTGSHDSSGKSTGHPTGHRPGSAVPVKKTPPIHPVDPGKVQKKPHPMDGPVGY